MLKNLLIWPNSGWTHERWFPPGKEADPEWPLLAMDALLRGSKKVSDQLSTCLAEQGIEMPRSEIRLMAGGLSGSGDLEVEIYDYTGEGPYVGSVRVPIGFHDLDVRRRDELVLQMWRETLTQIVARSGKDPAAVDRAADAARRDDYEVPRHGPWKQDRSRSRRVRLVGGLHDDGFLHLRVEIEELRGSRESRLSDVVIDSTLGWSFDKAAKSVRWESSDGDEGMPTVSVVIEGGGRFDLDGASGSIRVAGGFEEPWQIVPMGPAVPTGFRLLKKPDDHIDVLWGSAGYGFGAVPKEYEDERERIGDLVESPGWREWWEAVDVDEVRCLYEFHAGKASTVVRFTGRKLSVSIKRPTATIPTGAAAALLARRDAEDVLTRIAERRRILSAPALR